MPTPRTLPVLALAALSLLPVVGAQGVSAQTTIDLAFRPPDIPPQRVCVGRDSDEETVARWQDWDGQALPDVDLPLIRRDLKRLQQVDARQWYQTVSNMIDRLEERDPTYAGNTALLERITLMRAAGRYQDLRSRQLVPQLAAGEVGLSPREKNFLSGLYREGVGIDQDPAKADALLVDAGFSGNADAILTLTRLALNGTAPEAWDVPTDLAVSLAFGALLGELNPTICDRTARIAREYHSGTVVTADAQLAHDWYRFTADLGDGYAAWKVVEYHLEAEAIKKDNDVLLTYLRQAADTGLSFAQIELGRVYEVGALVPQDLDRALALFREAAKVGGRPALTRVALFLEEYADLYPGFDQERIGALRTIGDMDDAPGWVYTRLGDLELESVGLWEGRDAAEALYEKASALGDLDGTSKLAQLLITRRGSAADFERAVDLLSRAVSINGGVTPSKRLHAAFMCQAADSPRLEEANYWAGVEAATASANLDLSVADLLALNPQDHPLVVAVIQSQALYGRPTSLASWLKYLDYADFADPQMLQFWEAYSGRYPEVLKALAKLEFELAANRQDRLAALGIMREEYQKSGPDVALDLARAILSVQNEADPIVAAEGRAEALRLLKVPAVQGSGQAIRLLAALDSAPEAQRAVYDIYAPTIAKNGDFDALLFAIPFVDGEMQRDYISRAIGVMHCDYKSVLALANTISDLGDVEGALHWLGVAAELLEGNAWAMTDLARSWMRIGGPAQASVAWALFTRAHEAGDPSASRALFDLAINRDMATYAPETATELLKAAEAAEDAVLLSAYLGRYRTADPIARTEIAGQLNIPRMHLVVAKSGDIYAMRVYAQYLQENAQTSADLVASTDWMRRAAEGGDITAMAEYGEALAFGIGTTADSDAALAWLEQAAAGGSRKAGGIIRLVQLGQES